MIFLELAGAEFKSDVNVDGELLPMQVVRWQFPLTHGKVRTAFSAQCWTLEGGVIADLRRAGGLQDDDWRRLQEPYPGFQEHMHVDKTRPLDSGLGRDACSSVVCSVRLIDVLSLFCV